jgi:cold shock CspA family protein
MSSASSSDTSAPVRLTGRVKWFNNKTGFGFISVVGGNDQFKDASEVFVHHSAVTVSQEQYRYLVEGEYVEFSVVVTESGDHKFQAGDVRGVKGGKLFCETRYEHRASQDGGADASVERGERSERGRPQGRGQGYSVGRGGSSVGRGGSSVGRGGSSVGRGGSSVGRGGSSVGRGGRVDRGGRGGSEWMLVRRDRDEQTDSRGHGRGRNNEYSERPSRSDNYQSRAPVSTPAEAQVPAPTPASDEKEVNDVQATPRAAPTKRAPRQSKPAA